MTLEEMTAVIESGLTKWPDGDTAICVFNREPYQTFVLGYRLDGRTTDAQLVRAMLENLLKLKDERKAKFISWRKPLEFGEKDYIFEPTDLERGAGIPLINDKLRYLRCRVLITPHANDKDWHGSEEGINFA